MGRSRLRQMRLRAVVADRLALALLAAQKVDQRTAEHEAKDQRGKERPAGAKGDVAEKIEEVPAIRQICEPIKH